MGNVTFGKWQLSAVCDRFNISSSNKQRISFIVRKNLATGWPTSQQLHILFNRSWGCLRGICCANRCFWLDILQMRRLHSKQRRIVAQRWCTIKLVIMWDMLLWFKFFSVDVLNSILYEHILRRVIDSKEKGVSDLLSKDTGLNYMLENNLRDGIVFVE